MKEQHRRLVRKLMAAGAKRSCFRSAVLSELQLDATELRPLAKIRFVPDGYSFDHERREVTCFEVETTSPIDERRLAPYVEWWWILDDFDWNLRLIVIRGYRCHGVAFEIDLRAVSLTWSSSVSHLVGACETSILKGMNA